MSSEGVSKSIHQRLLNVRDRTGEDFNRLLVRYGLERLLYRLVAAKHGDAFVLKGAMLFSLWRDVPADRRVTWTCWGSATRPTSDSGASSPTPATRR